MLKPFKIRAAQLKDCANILGLIKELATYEKEPDAVLTTVSDLEDALFLGTKTFNNLPACYCLVIDDPDNENMITGFALYMLHFSTWTGKYGIYLEDLYVQETKRGQGMGKALLEHLAQICVKNDYQRFEWSVLDWNTPAWDFYVAKGSLPMTGWTLHRMQGQALTDLGKN
jgi:GNAT superfamily N-acetyltransferase